MRAGDRACFIPQPQGWQGRAGQGRAGQGRAGQGQGNGRRLHMSLTGFVLAKTTGCKYLVSTEQQSWENLKKSTLSSVCRGLECSNDVQAADTAEISIERGGRGWLGLTLSRDRGCPACLHAIEQIAAQAEDPHCLLCLPPQVMQDVRRYKDRSETPVDVGAPMESRASHDSMSTGVALDLCNRVPFC